MPCMQSGLNCDLVGPRYLCVVSPIWRFPKIWGIYHFWGPHNKDYSISGSILGSPYFGKLLYTKLGNRKIGRV